MCIRDSAYLERFHRHRYCPVDHSNSLLRIWRTSCRYRAPFEADEQMKEKEKSTDPGLSATERKALRVQEGREAIADHEEARKSFHENRERLRGERLVREAAAGPMVAPTPELPDDMPIERIIFSTRIQNALRAAGLNTVGEVRAVSD